ncbi:MAG: hypothetical protein M5U09_11225 [Gammaproteobacteria bacterium]|nr:hypothetical protein [Gammaproteobacteria bacterium]
MFVSGPAATARCTCQAHVVYSPADAFVANLLIGNDGGEQRIDRITGQLAERSRSHRPN